ncbi:hypothetical protein [Yoonia sp. SS1-5]|uniref:Excalibur calcium-binding domain-containing protein n=1 Tax=Yoonia rhodophyticola TaxID=3137370 RepID=A0AAN0M8E0_9RHOB
MKTGLVFFAGLVTLAACTEPRVVEPPRGVGFNDFAQFELDRARREAALSRPLPGSIIPPPQVNTIPGQPAPAAPTQTGAIPSSALAAAGIGQQAAPATVPAPAPVATAPVAAAPTPPANTGSDPLRRQGVDASPTNAPPVIQNNPSLSDEQNFDAVAGRETIESDAERRAAQAAAREQVQPTAVPQRPSNTGPNIVEYAINAPNLKGQEWYSRSLLSGQSRFQRNCAQYATPDDAQRDFLARGGPERDRRGIDPDGDGFACGWDPAPFKRAAGN